MHSATPPVEIVEISSAERDELAAEISRDVDPYAQFPAFLKASSQLRPPGSVEEPLCRFADRSGPGSLLIRNLPMPADLMPTPTVSFNTLGSPPVGSEPLLGMVGSRLGEPFSYREWDGGALVHNKYPIRAHRSIQFGSNAVDFLMHTETPFRSMSPDILVLLCLRGDPGQVAKTRVSDLERAIAGLPPEHEKALRQPDFAFETDQPVTEIDGVGYTQPNPVLSRRNSGVERPEYVEDLVGTTRSAREALAALRVLIHEGAQDVALESGDMLLLDNRRVVHGRNEFNPTYDGADRWLQRMLVSVDFRPPGPAAEDRLVPDQRYANYPMEYQRALSTPGRLSLPLRP